MNKFEYCIGYKSELNFADSNEQIQYLTRMGLEGWELVTIIPHPFRDKTYGFSSYDIYWKRRIRPITKLKAKTT